MRKENKAVGIIFSDFKLYYKAIVIQTVWYWHNRHISQWNRIESCKIDPYTYSQLIYKRAKNTQWERIVSSINDAGETGCKTTCKTKIVDHYLKPYTKITSKWIKDLNGRPGTIELQEENIDGRLLDIGLSNDFSGFDTKSKDN